jgi:hypothetical protein
MILQDILLNVRKYLDDDASATAGALQRWGDPELTFYVNQSYTHYYNQLVAKNLKTIVVEAYLDITANSRIITLPTNFLKASILERVDGTNSLLVPLDYAVNYDNVQDTTSQGISCFYPTYEFVGDANSNPAIKLSMTPDFSETGGLKLGYYKVNSRLSSILTDEPVNILKDQFVELIILDAAIKAKGGREEDEIANLQGMLSKLEDNFNEFLTSTTNARQYMEPFYTGGY